MTVESPGRTKKVYVVPSVAKAFDIIESIAERETASLTEISSRLKIPKSSTYQIITTLIDRGILRRVGESFDYSLGLRLFELGTKAIGSLNIRTEALPLLRELMQKTGQTCHLAILDGIEGVYLAKVESNRPIRIYSWEGKRLPLHSTAMGKVLLAWQDDSHLEKLLKKLRLNAYTSNTITDLQRLKRHLRSIRERGWALDDQENEPNIRCLGAPVRNVEGDVVAAISLSGLAVELTDDRLTKLSKLIMQTASELSKRMGNSAARGTRTR